MTPASTLPVWDPAVDDRFVCRSVRQVAPGTCTVVLAPMTPGAVRFDAGQFVTIDFDVDGGTVGRSYTIASPPTRPDRLAITVRRTTGGAVSPWLHGGGMAPGQVVRVGAPQGDFTMQAHPAQQYLLLTAGSGITPALSMVRRLYDLAEDCDVVVVHAQRTSEEVPYRRELETIADLLPGIRLHLLCSRAETDSGHVVAGRLSQPVLAALVPDAADREVLVCGPAGFLVDARAICAAVGCAADRVHHELFTLQGSSPPAGDPAGTSPAAEGFTVEFRESGVTVASSAEGTLLDAASRAGLTLPSSCAQGLCGTCKTTLVAGEVDMQHAGGIRPREIAAGKVLLCCSRPLTDVVVAC